MRERRSTLPNSFSDYFEVLQQQLDNHSAIKQAVEVKQQQVESLILTKHAKLFSGKATSKSQLQRIEREHLVQQRLKIGKKPQRIENICEMEFEKKEKSKSKSPHERALTSNDLERTKQALQFVRRMQQRQQERHRRQAPARSLQLSNQQFDLRRRQLRNVLQHTKILKQMTIEENPQETQVVSPRVHKTIDLPTIDSCSKLGVSHIKVTKRRRKTLPSDKKPLKINYTVETSYLQGDSPISGKHRRLPPPSGRWQLSNHIRNEQDEERFQHLNENKLRFLQHLRRDIKPRMGCKPYSYQNHSSLPRDSVTDRGQLVHRGNKNMKQGNRSSVKYRQLPRGLSYEKVEYDPYERLLRDSSKPIYEKLDQIMTRSAFAEQQLDDTRFHRKHLQQYDPSELDQEYISSVKAKMQVLNQLLS